MLPLHQRRRRWMRPRLYGHGTFSPSPYCTGDVAREISPLMNSKLEPCWLAGLLEGEGSFIKAASPAVVLPMTDRDVVERVARVFARRVQRWRRRDAGSLKPVFITTVKGAAAVHLMRTLRPLFGTRRQGQIDRALARWTERSIRWREKPKMCSADRCSERPAIKALCLKHYKSWWRSRKHGRVSQYVPRSPAGLLTVGAPLLIPPRDDPRAVAWLAGLLEGEGTFGAAKARRAQYPVVSVEMTDEDVVRRAADIMGIANVYRVEPREAEWSATFVARFSGHRAANWMRTLRPHMGRRRTRAIDRALAAYKPIRLVDPPPTCVVGGCAKPHESRGLCHKHYMSWSRDRAKGREPRVRTLR